MNYKSQRAKNTDISPKVKAIVYERDKGKCIICGRPGIPNAHYKRRSQGGLGIEQNVVTLCLRCHEDFDNGFKREEIENYIHDYLKSIYGTSWCEEDLIYNKWKNFKFK